MKVRLSWIICRSGGRRDRGGFHAHTGPGGLRSARSKENARDFLPWRRKEERCMRKRTAACRAVQRKSLATSPVIKADRGSGAVAVEQAGIPASPQLVEYLVGQLPGIALEANDQLLPDALEGAYCVTLIEANTGRQQGRDVFGEAAGELFQPCAARPPHG